MTKVWRHSPTVYVPQEWRCQVAQSAGSSAPWRGICRWTVTGLVWGPSASPPACTRCRATWLPGSACPAAHESSASTRRVGIQLQSRPTPIFSLCTSLHQHNTSVSILSYWPFYGDWYTGLWCTDSYIWYSEDRPGRGANLSRSFLAVIQHKCAKQLNEVYVSEWRTRLAPGGSSVTLWYTKDGTWLGVQSPIYSPLPVYQILAHQRSVYQTSWSFPTG